MILVYGHCDGWLYEYQAWKPLGLVATVAEAEELCAAYAAHRVEDIDGIWSLHWIALDTRITLPEVRAWLAMTTEPRAHGDDTTPAEAQAQAADRGCYTYVENGVRYARPWTDG